MNQLGRFARLFVMGAVPAELAFLAGGTKVTVAAVAVIAIPAFETAWRVMFPTVPASSLAPGSPAPSAAPSERPR